MARLVLGVSLATLLTINFLHSVELAENMSSEMQEKKETAATEKKEMEVPSNAEHRSEIHRKWVKKSRSNAPRGRKALPGKKKALSSIGELKAEGTESTNEETALPAGQRDPS